MGKQEANNNDLFYNSCGEFLYHEFDDANDQYSIRFVFEKRSHEITNPDSAREILEILIQMGIDNAVVSNIYNNITKLENISTQKNLLEIEGTIEDPFLDEELKAALEMSMGAPPFQSELTIKEESNLGKRKRGENEEDKDNESNKRQRLTSDEPMRDHLDLFYSVMKQTLGFNEICLVFEQLFLDNQDIDNLAASIKSLLERESKSLDNEDSLEMLMDIQYCQIREKFKPNQISLLNEKIKHLIKKIIVDENSVISKYIREHLANINFNKKSSDNEKGKEKAEEDKVGPGSNSNNIQEHSTHIEEDDLKHAIELSKQTFKEDERRREDQNSEATSSSTIGEEKKNNISEIPTIAPYGSKILERMNREYDELVVKFKSEQIKADVLTDIFLNSCKDDKQSNQNNADEYAQNQEYAQIQEAVRLSLLDNQTSEEVTNIEEKAKHLDELMDAFADEHPEEIEKNCIELVFKNYLQFLLALKKINNLSITDSEVFANINSNEELKSLCHEVANIMHSNKIDANYRFEVFVEYIKSYALEFFKEAYENPGFEEEVTKSQLEFGNANMNKDLTIQPDNRLPEEGVNDEANITGDL